MTIYTVVQSITPATDTTDQWLEHDRSALDGTFVTLVDAASSVPCLSSSLVQASTLVARFRLALHCVRIHFTCSILA